MPEGVGVQLFNVGRRNLQYGLTTNEFPLDPKKGLSRSGLIPQVCDGFADTEQLANEALQRRAECEQQFGLALPSQCKWMGPSL